MKKGQKILAIIFLIFIVLLAIIILYNLYKKKETFQLQTRVDGNGTPYYAVVWNPIKSFGNTDPANFTYTYYVWDGSHPDYNAIINKSSADQTGQTKLTYFELNTIVSYDPGQSITVIVGADNSLETTYSDPQIFTSSQNPIKNVSVKNAIDNNDGTYKFPNAPNIVAQLDTMEGVTSPTAEITITLPGNGGTFKPKYQPECGTIIDNTFSCVTNNFGKDPKNLFGGNKYSITASVLASGKKVSLPANYVEYVVAPDLVNIKEIDYETPKPFQPFKGYIVNLGNDGKSRYLSLNGLNISFTSSPETIFTYGGKNISTVVAGTTYHLNDKLIFSQGETGVLDIHFDPVLNKLFTSDNSQKLAVNSNFKTLVLAPIISYSNDVWTLAAN